MIENATIRQWMSRPALVIRPEASITAAHMIMENRKVRRLAVVNECGKLIGIVTLGDVREAQPSDPVTLNIWEINYLREQSTIGKIMTNDVITIRPNANIIDAAKLMLDQKISGLPVVDENGTLLGMITESDVFRVLAEAGSKAAGTT
jgi:CBS domain-containing protein